MSRSRERMPKTCHGPLGEFRNRLERTRDGSRVRSLTVEEWVGVIRGSGLDPIAVGAHPKRRDCADWLGRSAVATGDRMLLESALREAPAAVKSRFSIECEGHRVGAFTDVRTLFVAVKPESRPDGEGV